MTPRLPTLFAAALLSGVCGVPSRADYIAAFGNPPFTAEQSIIGIDGWTYRLAPATDQSDKSRIVAVRWNNYQPAVRLSGANLRNVLPPTRGTKVRITFDLAFTFPETGGTGKQFRLGLVGAPCGEIFMDLAADGGLGYRADGSGQGGVVVLAKKDTRINSFYTYTVTVDYTKMTFDTAITGTKKDGTPLNFVAEGVPFESKARNISSIYIISGGGSTAYLGSLSIKSE